MAKEWTLRVYDQLTNREAYVTVKANTYAAAAAKIKFASIPAELWQDVVSEAGHD